MASHPNAGHFRREEMMRTFRFFAVLIFSFFPTFLFGQTADTDFSTQPENENVTTLTGPLNANRSALPQAAGEVRQHLSDPMRHPNRATVDVDALALPSLPSDPKWSGDPRCTVSVSSLATPEKARKAFNKGEQEA